MDVIFEPQKGRGFTIEVGFFDTVLEIKEKIQKYHRIPIPKQTLIFNGHVLQDDRDVEFCEILQNSRIQLIVAPSSSDHSNNNSNNNNNAAAVKIEIPNSPNSPSPSPNSNRMIHLQSQFPIEIDPTKDQMESAVVPLNELSDNNSEIEVVSAATSATVGSTGSSKKLKVLVKPKCGSQKIPVEVNASDNVGELKKELQKLQQRLHFHLPQEGFFFIYDRDVMDEDRSFRWHGVAHGDTIEIFNGSVTGGS